MSLLHDYPCAVGLPTAADRLRHKRRLVAQQRCRWSRVAAGLSAAVGVLLAMQIISDVSSEFSTDVADVQVRSDIDDFVGPISYPPVSPAPPWRVATAHLAQPMFSLRPMTNVVAEAPRPSFSELFPEPAAAPSKDVRSGLLAPMLVGLHARITAAAVDQFIRRASTTLIHPIVRRFAWTQIIDPTISSPPVRSSNTGVSADLPSCSTELERDRIIRGFHLPWEFR